MISADRIGEIVKLPSQRDLADADDQEANYRVGRLMAEAIRELLKERVDTLLQIEQYRKIVKAAIIWRKDAHPDREGELAVAVDTFTGGHLAEKPMYVVPEVMMTYEELQEKRAAEKRVDETPHAVRCMCDKCKQFS
jgi:hypothetical protein